MNAFAVNVELVQMVVPPAEFRLDVLVKIDQGAVGNLNSPPDRRFHVEQGDLELIKQVALLRGRLASLGRFFSEQAHSIRGEKFSNFVQHRHEPLLVRAGNADGGGPDFVVEMIEFLAGDADDLRTFSRFLQSLLDLVLDPGAVNKAFPLLLGERERVRLAGLPCRL